MLNDYLCLFICPPSFVRNLSFLPASSIKYKAICWAGRAQNVIFFSLHLIIGVILMQNQTPLLWPFAYFTLIKSNLLILQISFDITSARFLTHQGHGYRWFPGPWFYGCWLVSLLLRTESPHYLVATLTWGLLDSWFTAILGTAYLVSWSQTEVSVQFPIGSSPLPDWLICSCKNGWKNWYLRIT